MAEIVSREAARLVSNSAGGKIRAASNGKTSVSIITGPTTAAWAQNDTCGNRVRIPAGSRMIGAYVSNAACGTSVTMDVGLRTFTTDGTGTVVDVDALVDGLDVSSAQSTFNASGSAVAAGAEDVTTVDTEAYFTLLSANPTDDADIRVTVLYVAA